MTTYQIRVVDAWSDGEGWTYNESHHLAYATISNKTKNIEEALLYHMRKHGLVSKRGKTRLEYDGSIYELVERATGKPLVAFIPMED